MVAFLAWLTAVCGAETLVWENRSQENFMAASQSRDDEEASTNEDRFARQDFNRHSRLSSAVALIAIVSTIAAVVVYLAMRR